MLMSLIALQIRRTKLSKEKAAKTPKSGKHTNDRWRGIGWQVALGEAWTRGWTIAFVPAEMVLIVLMGEGVSPCPCYNTIFLIPH